MEVWEHTPRKDLRGNSLIIAMKLSLPTGKNKSRGGWTSYDDTQMSHDIYSPIIASLHFARDKNPYTFDILVCIPNMQAVWLTQFLDLGAPAALSVSATWTSNQSLFFSASRFTELLEDL